MLNREIDRSLPRPIPLSDAAAITILAALELVAIWCVIRIWRERDRPIAARLFWTVVTLVPVLGLIAYAVWWDPPPLPKDPTDRRRGSKLGDDAE